MLLHQVRLHTIILYNSVRDFHQLCGEEPCNHSPKYIYKMSGGRLRPQTARTARDDDTDSIASFQSSPSPTKSTLRLQTWTGNQQVRKWRYMKPSGHAQRSCSSRVFCLMVAFLHGLSCSAAAALSDTGLRTDFTPLPGRLTMMSIIRC